MVNAKILASSVGFYKTPIVVLTLTDGNGDHSPLISREVEFIGQVLWKNPILCLTAAKGL